MIRKLRVKFVCITMVIVTVMLGLLLTSQYISTRNSLEQRSLSALETAAREPRDRIRPGFGKPGTEDPCFIVELDAWGRLSVSGSAYYDLSDQTLLLEIYRAAEADGALSGVLADYSLRYYRADKMGQVCYAFTDISAEQETLRELLHSSLLMGALGFFGFLLLAVLLANWAIRPVERAWEQQRRFVADASHELKTPLTVLLTNAELLRERAEDDQQRQFSDSIVTMSHQMRGLVEGMLQLARADCGQTAAERERLDYSALLEQILLPFEPVYFEGGLTLESRIQPGVSLTGSAAQLRQVAEILLDNALKYATPGGTVRVTMHTHHHQCVLAVASPGDPMTPAQCREIFVRFYRMDAARSRNGGYGLGLSIAQRIVTDHRGRIWAESRDGINTFYVNLPAG